MTSLINQIYKKERTYVKSNDKDNTVTVSSPIFDLEKIHNLKTHTGVELKEVNEQEEE